MASVRHDRIRRLSTQTVQAPHVPWSQPFLVPESSRCSRRASSKLVRGSSRRVDVCPLIRSVISTGSGPSMGSTLVCMCVFIAFSSLYLLILLTSTLLRPTYFRHALQSHVHTNTKRQR